MADKKPTGKPRALQNLSGTFDFILPDGLADATVSNGTIRVRGLFPIVGDGDIVKAYCYPSASATPDLTPPAGAVSCNYDGTYFFSDVVPAAQVGGTGYNNTVFAWHNPQFSTEWILSYGVRFRGVAPVGDIEVIVRGTSCIAYAYADNNFVGPSSVGTPGGGTIDDSSSFGIAARPTQVLIPSTANSSVALTYKSGEWTHWKAASPSVGTDANGRTTSPPGKTSTRGEYLTPEYNSANLLIPFNHRNRLIAAFGDDNGYKGDVFDVGNSKTLTIPAGAKYLYLAMHDGYQWNGSSNDGTIKVGVVFS